MNRAPLLFLVALLLSTTGMAEEDCRVTLHHDLRVSSELLEVSKEGTQLYEIRRGGEVTVAGKPLNLTTAQRSLAQGYAGDVAALITQWIELVSTTLNFAGTAVETAMGEAFGKDSPAVTKSSEALALARQRFESMTQSEDGVYRLNATEFNDLDESLDQDEEIAEAVALSVGSLFTAIGNAIASGEGTFAERMEAFGERMEKMAEGLESQGRTLEETSQALCAEMKAIQKLEEDVGDEIPQLEKYALFD